MTLSRRQRIALLLAGVALAGTALAFAALPIQNGDPVSGGVTFHASDGPAVNVTPSTEADLSALFPDANTVDLRTTNGNVTLSSTGRTNATVTQLTGTETRLQGLDVATNDLTIDPEDKTQVVLGGGMDAFEWRSPTLDDATSDFSYTASGSVGTLTIGGLPADTTVVARDSGGNVLDSATTDSSGTATFSSLDTGTYDVELGEPLQPDFDATTASPTGDLQNDPGTLEINVSDADFPDDSVTVEFFLDGSTVGTDTLTSNGTASVSIGTQTGGAHTWNATATDTYGASTTSQDFDFNVPSTLQIRNESAPNNLITGVEVTITWFGSDRVITNTTTTGEIDMTGLPVEDFIVQVDESTNFHSRTIWVQSLYEQQNVYLLNTSVTTVESRFVLNDVTGQFSEESLVIISRPLTVSGTTEYRTIIADEFGTEGVTATLEEGVRYRVQVRSQDGTVQDLGPYRADVGETVTLEPGAPAVSVTDPDAGWGSAATIDGTQLTIRFEDPEADTDSVTVYIHERGNESNQLVANETYVDPTDLSIQHTLTQNESELTWVVNLEVTRDGETFTVRHVVSNTPDGTFPSMGQGWINVFGIGVLLLFAGIFSVLNRVAGVILTGILGGILWYFGWLAGATSAFAVLLVLFVAIVYAVYASGQPG